MLTGLNFLLSQRPSLSRRIIPILPQQIKSCSDVSVFIIMDTRCKMVAKAKTILFYRAILYQEAQLMLTISHDAFRAESRSPFHMLGIVSSCTIVTLSLRRAVFTIFDFKKCRDIKTRVRGHSSSLKVVPFDKLRMISY